MGRHERQDAEVGLSTNVEGEPLRHCGDGTHMVLGVVGNVPLRELLLHGRLREYATIDVGERMSGGRASRSIEPGVRLSHLPQVPLRGLDEARLAAPLLHQQAQYVHSGKAT